MEETLLGNRLRHITSQQRHALRLNEHDIHLVEQTLNAIKSSSGQSRDGLRDNDDVVAVKRDFVPVVMYGERVRGERFWKQRARVQSATTLGKFNRIESESENSENDDDDDDDEEEDCGDYEGNWVNDTCEDAAKGDSDGINDDVDESSTPVLPAIRKSSANARVKTKSKSKLKPTEKSTFESVEKIVQRRILSRPKSSPAMRIYASMNSCKAFRSHPTMDSISETTPDMYAALSMPDSVDQGKMPAISRETSDVLSAWDQPTSSNRIVDFDIDIEAGDSTHVPRDTPGKRHVINSRPNSSTTIRRERQQRTSLKSASTSLKRIHVAWRY